jgi:hypothetical protein
VDGGIIGMAGMPRPMRVRYPRPANRLASILHNFAWDTPGEDRWPAPTVRLRQRRPGKTRAKEMRKATYQRIQGKRYTYQIRYDHAGYEVSRSGEIKKIGLVPKTLVGSVLTRDEAMDRGLFSAELDIESLIGMEE